MFKCTVFVLLFSSQFVAFAQTKEEKFKLKLQRETNGQTEIIDTSFATELELSSYLKSLDKLEKGERSNAQIKMYKLDKKELDKSSARTLRHSDSLHQKIIIERLDRRIGDHDSLDHHYTFELDSNLIQVFSFNSKMNIDSNLSWQFMEKNGDSEELTFHAKKLMRLHDYSLKTMKLHKIESADLNKLSNELQSKLKETSPPLPLHELKVFPNPSDGLVQLSFRVDTPATLKIRVLNAAGHAIFTETTPNISGLYLTEIDLRNAGKGTYYVYVLHGKKSAVRKLLLQ